MYDDVRALLPTPPHPTPKPTPVRCPLLAGGGGYLHGRWALGEPLERREARGEEGEELKRAGAGGWELGDRF
jgi:hypothetical protein